jgi:4-amino-4-deoxy-L-arabinose transferase-like glycosyltransferase
MNQSPRYGRLLIAGTVALFLLRFALSLLRTGPVLVADEIGYLTNARVIDGGLAGLLEQAPFYRGGYSLLIAPLLELGGSPTFLYHLVLVLNAALAASVFPLLYLLLTRFAGVRPERAIWAALAGAVYPALTVLSQVAMSENALFPLVCLWLIAFGGLLSEREGRGDFAWAAALGAATGGLWAVHNRMIVAVAVALAGMVWLTVRRRLRPAALVLGVALVALAFFGVHLLDSSLIDDNYAGSAPDELSERMDSLLQFGGLRTALANLLGQTWYLLVATFGLAAVAIADFAQRRRPLLGVLLALTALLLAISASAFPERTRPDMLIYGRYAEVVAPALIAFGLAALSRVRLRLAWPLAGLGVLTALVVLIRATASDPDAANRWNVSALPFITVQLGPAILIGAALVALGGAWLLTRATAFGPKATGVAALALFLAVAAYGAWNPVRSSQRAVYPAGWTSPQSAAEDAGAKTIAYDLDSYDTIGLYSLQWFLPNTKVTLFDQSREEPDSRFVLAGEDWPQRQDVRATPLWEAAGRDQVLWRVSGPGAG